LDYTENKIKLLTLEAHLEQNKLSKLMYENYKNFTIEDNKDLIDQFNEKYEMDNAYQLALNLNKSKYQKAKTIRKRTKSIIENNEASFITITFRDDVLNKTSEKTRRVYVARWLKTLTNVYIANKDYGTTTNREHYHAIVKSRTVKKTWKYGFIDIKKITPNWKSNKNLSLYVSKLSHHALKTSSKNTRIIYSKKLVIL
jgi:hypothetical protein